MSEVGWSGHVSGFFFLRVIRKWPEVQKYAYLRVIVSVRYNVKILNCDASRC